jgi:hypothetical protein
MSALSIESQPWFNPYPRTAGLPFYLQSNTFARISNCFHTPFFTQSRDSASRTSRFTLTDGSARPAAQLRLSGDRAMVMRSRKICLTIPSLPPLRRQSRNRGETPEAIVVKQAARVRSSRSRARELLRNSLRWFSDPIRNEAAWPPLRCGQTARRAKPAEWSGAS